MSQLFAWGGQSTGVSALASFLPKNTQGWSPLERTGWLISNRMDLLAVQGTLKSYWTTKKKHRQLTEIRKNNSEQDKMFDKEIEIYIKKKQEY